MKPKLNKNQTKALDKLRQYGGAIDLTGENVQNLKDRKIKKTLEPILMKLLPRRRKGIESSSYYRMLRVKALPYNPYFKQDVDDLRQLFQIPSKQITAIDLSPYPDRTKIYKPETSLPAENVAAFWIQIHRHIWAKTELIDSLPPFLPGWMECSAGSSIKLGEDASLPWLKKKPKIPELYSAQFDLRLPLDSCVARLIERYQLPWQSVPNLVKYILTRNDKHLKSIYPFDVLMEMIQTPIGNAYRVTVDWIDEYTTREQWEDIYQDIIQKRQEKFWEDRGDTPHSKHIEFERLLQQTSIDFLRYSLKGVGVDAMLDNLSKKGKLPLGDIDRSTAYRLVNTLRSIMKPAD